MGTPQLTALLRRLSAERRVVLLGGLAVIAHGFSRPTKDCDIWLEPMSSPEEWAWFLCAAVNAAPSPLTLAKLPHWAQIESPDEVAVIACEIGMVRVTGLEMPLDIFRHPNELEEDQFDFVWSHGALNVDGVRVAHPVDLLLSKEATDRERDFRDQQFLEDKIRAEWNARLPQAPRAEAEALLARYADHAVCATALRNPDAAVQKLARALLEEMAAAGDPFSRDALAGQARR